MPVAGGALAVGGMAGQMITGGKEANDAQNAAMQQQSRANQALSYAMPTTAELNNISFQNQQAQTSLNFQGQQLGAMASQMAAIDPTIKAAFSQQTQLMNGQVPDFLKPLQTQLQQYAQQNQSRINAQMGQGASSSSAGAMANATFANQAGQTMMNAQVQALGALGQAGANAAGVQSQMQQAGSNMIMNTANINNSAFGMSNALQTRQTQAALGTVSAQGADQTAGIMENQQWANMFGKLSGMGAAYATNGASAAAPSGGGSGTGFNANSYGSSGFANTGGPSLYGSRG